MSLGQVLGSLNWRRYHWIFKLLVATLKSEVWGQNYEWLFYYFRNYDILKSKSPCVLLNKNINFNKNKTEPKMENHTVLKRRTLCFSSYKNHKLKVKLWWLGPPERKKRHFLYYLFCLKEIFLTCVLSQCIVY